MSNKPRSLESSSSNLFRAAILLALVPACATTLPTARTNQENEHQERFDEMWALTENGRRHFRIAENQHIICGTDENAKGKLFDAEASMILRDFASTQLRIKLMKLLHLDDLRQRGIVPQAGDVFHFSSTWYIGEAREDVPKGRICVLAQTSYKESAKEEFEKAVTEFCRDPYFAYSSPSCEKQRRDKAANISAEMRSKLAKGSKPSNRRSR